MFKFVIFSNIIHEFHLPALFGSSRFRYFVQFDLKQKNPQHSNYFQRLVSFKISYLVAQSRIFAAAHFRPSLVKFAFAKVVARTAWVLELALLSVFEEFAAEQCWPMQPLLR
jgi:hypothetical protein